MFGSSSPFGQSSSSPFGSPSVFGQNSNQNNNPFAPQPFGQPAASPFGAQTGSSIFGGTSTGVFGATQSSSPFSSTTTFGASSSPAFGSSTPAFGASSTPSAFGGFGQPKPAFGAFGSTPSQPSPFGSTSQPSQPAFGSTSQPSQPAFGNSLFGSTTAFGAQSQSAFGASSTPAFGASSTPAFGASSTPAFGSTPSTSLFGASSSSAFGAPSTTPAFGAPTASAFGASNTPAFGASSSPAFGASSSPAFSFSSSPAFGQSTSAFGNTGFGTTTTSSPFGAQSSPFGSQSATPAFGASGTFGQPGFGGQQRGGSRVAAFTPTPEPDSGAGATAGKLESISAMPVYKDKSHEELRWEDYQLGDKGGPMAATQPAGISFGAAAQPGFPGASPSQPSTGIFSSNTSSSNNIFAPKAPTTLFNSSGFGTSLTSSPSIFNPTPTTPSPFGTTSAAPFSNTTPSPFPSSSPGFASSSFPTQGSAPAFNTGLFTSASPITQTNNAFATTTSAFGTGLASSFNTQPSLFSTPSTGFAGVFSSTPSLTSTTNNLPFSQTNQSIFSTPFSAAQPAQPSFSFNPQQQQQANGGGGAGSGMFGNLQSSGAVQAVPASNPFGTLPAMPQVSIGRGGNSPSLQYGISSMPVMDKAAPLRISSLLTSRHLSQRRIRLPARKYHPKTDATKVPFFSDDEETAGTPKADALFLPRENPRALVIRPAEQWPLKASADKASILKNTSPVHQNGDGVSEERENGVKANEKKANGVHDYPKLNGHNRAGEAAIVYEHGAGIEALMPKLRRSDYFTEPRIQELAAKERAEPGFCRHVTDFVIGRHGFGFIRFLGETDVRGLDLDWAVQFNNREVIVYMDDDAKKPPVGQGLNKPAEVTLLNIKCLNKKTGREFTEGPSVEKYREMLKRKTEDQGAEFLSFDPVKGEWKFRVKHFSRYRLVEDDEDEPEMA